MHNILICLDIRGPLELTIGPLEVLTGKAMQNWKISFKALSKRLQKLTIKMKFLISLF